MSHSHCDVMMDGHEHCAGSKCHLDMDPRCSYYNGSGMRQAQDMVRRFHEKYNCTVSERPKVLDLDERNFRLFLIDEEIQELREALEDEDLIRIADALGDSIYVLLGTGVAYGIELDAVFAEIQRSNMTKTRPFGHNAKPLKGIKFSPPQIARLLESMSQ